MYESKLAFLTPLFILAPLIACGDAGNRSTPPITSVPSFGESPASGSAGTGSSNGIEGNTPSPSRPDPGTLSPIGGLAPGAGSEGTGTVPPDDGALPISNPDGDTPVSEMPGVCNVDPVTPNATPQTRKVLCYLHSIYGNHILSGQEEDNNDNAANYILATTGKYPAIRAFDVNNGRAAAQCVEHWQKGGLCMFGYHMGLIGGDGYQGSMTATDVNLVITEGSPLNQTFKARLDKTAQALQTVQNAGGVAILRLFHEAGNRCGWFWWGNDPDKFVRLWRYTFEYMTTTKGLRNIVWMVSLCGSPTAAFNPGQQYTDLGGADSYVGDGNYDALNPLFNRTVTSFPGMPVALHECGPIPDPAQLLASGTKWLMFNVWTGNYPKPPSNSVEHLNAVYKSDYVLTRDELPSFLP